MHRLSKRMTFSLPFPSFSFLFLLFHFHYQAPSSKDVEPLVWGLLRRPVDPSGLGHGMPSVPVLAQTPPNRARDHFRILSTTGTRPASVPLPAASPSEFLATPKIRLSQPPITPPV